MTLIEVMLAMIVLSIAAAGLLLGMLRSLAVVKTARNRETARSLVARVDIEYPIESVDLDDMSESGTFEDNEGFIWYRDIEMVDQEERPGLFIVTTRVQWSERGREAFEETMIYRYAPDAEVVTSQL